MQNRTDFSTPLFSASQPMMTFPPNDIPIKVPKCIKYEINVYNGFRFLVCFQYFQFFFHYVCVDK